MSTFDEPEKRHKDLVDAAMIDYNSVLDKTQIEPFAFLLDEAVEFEDTHLLGHLNGIIKRTPSIDGSRAKDLVEVLKSHNVEIPGFTHTPNPNDDATGDE